MNEPQSLHELHQEDAEEERKRIGEFDRMARDASARCSRHAWVAAFAIREAQMRTAFFEEEMIVILHALWSAVRQAGNLHILERRQILESLEEAMMVTQELYERDDLASDSLEARERT